MSKHSRVNSSYQLNIQSEALKFTFLTHRNAVSTTVKRIMQTIDSDGQEKEEIVTFAQTT